MEKKTKNSQLQSIQTDHSIAIEKLTAGIAHELNNPLTGIKGFADLLKNKDELPREKQMIYLNKIINFSNRMSKVIKNMSVLSKNIDADQLKEININSLISEIFCLVEKKLHNSHINVNLDLPEDEYFVMATMNLISTLIQNLLSNSYDAFALRNEIKNKRISISIDELENQKLKITYKDNAGGMNAKIYEQAFKPFYTTKKAGTGVGLGLTICKKIIEDLNGDFKAFTQEDLGTHFEITLPFARKVELEDIHTATEDQTSEKDTSSSCDAKHPQENEDTEVLHLNEKIDPKKIILIDDEVDLLEYLSDVIKDHHSISQFSNANEAVNSILQNSYDLIITDIKMPFFSGEQIADLIRRKNKTIPIIFISGQVDEQVSYNLNRFSPFRFLQKPLPESSEIVQTINESFAS